MSFRVDTRSRSERTQRVASALREGEVLAGRYRVGGALGRGGMGAVFEGFHVELGRRVAIKTLLSDHVTSEEAIRRFQREAMVAASLESKHIVHVIDWAFGESGAPAIVMEYVNGESLRSVLAREGPISLRRTIYLLVQVCRGLRVAHEAGIIHRDLKPSNLLISKEPDGHEHCTVLDFGVAKTDENWESSLESATTHTGALVGTLSYMSPEQIRGERGLDARADVYAVGALLYECLGGRRPFEAESPHALIYRVLHEQPTSLLTLRPTLPAEVWRVAARALAKDRTKRFQSVDELAQALNALLANSTANGVRDTTLTDADHDVRGPLPTRSRRLQLAAVLVFTVCGAAFLAQSRSTGASPPPRTSVKPERPLESPAPAVQQARSAAALDVAAEPTRDAPPSSSNSTSPSRTALPKHPSRLISRPSASAAPPAVVDRVAPERPSDSSEGTQRFDFRNPYRSQNSAAFHD
ncbi:MAG: serine/threonine-protein kinase [Myxococcota bacterium]